MGAPDWPGYLAAFHDARPGVTEAVLRRAANGDDAYRWLAAALPEEGRVVDLACGNAALTTALPGRPYLGIDTSIAELRAAERRGVTALVQADAAALPLADNSVGAVACSMALQILAPLEQVLAEVSRVLQPGGRLVAVVPAGGPLQARDLPVAAGLLTVLGRRLDYPNDRHLARIGGLLEAYGLRLIADERRRYGYPLRIPADADLLLNSLYLPDLASWRHRATRGYLRALARIRVVFPVPIRRIVAEKAQQ